MGTIVAAVIGGVILLWGGIAAMLRAVDVLQRRHAMLLGAYATLVVAVVMGLVLYTSYERQKQHRAELQAQMDEFSQRLSQLSDRLVAQLEEKADLTASEFEVRAELQHERQSHGVTAVALERQQSEYGALKETLDQQLALQRQYQTDVDQQVRQRAEAEDQRYHSLQQTSEAHERALQSAQQTLESLQQAVTRLAAQTSSIQEALATGHRLLETRTQEIDQKVEALARSQAAVQDGVGAVRARVDSLYKWRKD